MWFALANAGLRSFVSRVVVRIGRSENGEAMRALLRILREILKDLSRVQTIRLTVSSNCRDVGRWVDDRGKQIQYATAVALTRTAKRLEVLMQDEVKRCFDRPVPFTINAFGITPATKARLQSSLFIKSRQAAYLRPEIVGGSRGRKPFERRLDGEAKGAAGYWAPGQGVRLNAAGNLSKSQITAIARSLHESGKYGSVFVGKPVGHPGAPFGIWSRTKPKNRRSVGELRPLLIQIADPSYKPRFDFYGVAARNVQRIFNDEFGRAYADALRSVRPPSQKLEVILSRLITAKR